MEDIGNAIIAFVLATFIIFMLVVACAPSPTPVRVESTPQIESGSQIVNRSYDPEYDVVCYYIRTDMECLKANKKVGAK